MLKNHNKYNFFSKEFYFTLYSNNSKFYINCICYERQIMYNVTMETEWVHAVSHAQLCRTPIIYFLGLPTDELFTHHRLIDHLYRFIFRWIHTKLSDSTFQYTYYIQFVF